MSRTSESPVPTPSLLNPVIERCHLCRDLVEPNRDYYTKGGKYKTCERCAELVRAPPCHACGKPVRDACRSDPEPYHMQCRRCKSCYQVVAQEDVVKLAGQLLCSTCDHLFGKFFIPKRRAQAERMKEAFQAWDCDGSGSIEVGELRRVLKALDPDFADRDLGKLFSMIDMNHNGVIEYEEFCQWIMKGTPIDIAEDGFEGFVAGLMRSAGLAAQQAELEIVEVQLRPDGLLFVRKCGDEKFVTRALTSKNVKLTRLDPEEFICQVECTEEGLVLTMNTGRVSIVEGRGRLFGPWQAPEGFHIVGLRTKPADVHKASEKTMEVVVEEPKPTRKTEHQVSTKGAGHHRAHFERTQTLPVSPDGSVFNGRHRSKTRSGTVPAMPKAATGPLKGEQIMDAVVGVDLAPLPAAKSYDASCALRFAAEHDFLYTLQRLLAKASVDVNGFGPGGVTALMLAAQHGNVGAMRLLLGSKASPSITDPDGWTALTFASRCGQTTGVQILLDRGATQEGDGGAALREALRHQHNSAARALLRAGFLPLPKGTFQLEDPVDSSRFTLGAPTFAPAGSVFSKPVAVELLPPADRKAVDRAASMEAAAQEDAANGGEQTAHAKALQEAQRRAHFVSESSVRILYTTDGRDPFVNGRRYKGPITLTSPRTHLRVVAVRGQHDGLERSEEVDGVYVVCHYAMPDDVVSGALKVRAFTEAADVVAQALASTLQEPLERVRVQSYECEGSPGAGCWLRVPLCDPRPRHCVFIDRSFATVRGNKLKGFIDNFRTDVLQAVGCAPEDIDVHADLRAGRSTHKAGSIAIEFTLRRELAEEVRMQLDDPSSYMLTKAKGRSFFSDANLQVVEPLSDRLTDPALHSQLHDALGKKASVDEVIGFGTMQEGMIAVALSRSETKKLKDRGTLAKAIQAALPNIELSEVREGPCELDVDYTVDVISGCREEGVQVDGISVVKDLNSEDFSRRLMFQLAQANLPLQAAVSSRATSRELSQLEFHLEWTFPATKGSGPAKKDYLDGICMIYCGNTLAQVIDFRSAHEDSMVHDGEHTEEAASLCRSIHRAVQHSGDILSDVGGEHCMSLDLDALPPNVTDLFFVLAAFDCDDLSLFQNPAVQIHDVVLGRELTSYRIESAGHAKAVVMCSFTRDPDHGKWVVYGLGIPTTGNAKDYEPIKKTINSCQMNYSRWERRACLVKIRVLHKCKRLTQGSRNEFAKLLWRILSLPTNIFQLVVLWL